MATSFPAPPTFAEPVIVDPVTKKSSFNPIWLNWFLVYAQLLEAAASGVSANHENLQGLLGGAASDHYHFTSAEHTLLQAFEHAQLNSLQGGTAAEYYHLTSAEHTTATSGPSQAVTSITPPTTGGVWQNTTGFNVLVVAQGGTTPTYALSRDNATFYPVGTPTVIPVVRGDYLQVNYGATPPTLDYFAM